MKLQSGIPCRKGPELGLSDEKLISQNLRRIIGSTVHTEVGFIYWYRTVLVTKVCSTSVSSYRTVRVTHHKLFRKKLQVPYNYGTRCQ